MGKPYLTILKLFDDKLKYDLVKSSSVSTDETAETLLNDSSKGKILLVIKEVLLNVKFLLFIGILNGDRELLSTFSENQIIFVIKLLGTQQGSLFYILMLFICLKIGILSISDDSFIVTTPLTNDYSFKDIVNILPYIKSSSDNKYLGYYIYNNGNDAFTRILIDTSIEGPLQKLNELRFIKNKKKKLKIELKKTQSETSFILDYLKIMDDVQTIKLASFNLLKFTFMFDIIDNFTNDALNSKNQSDAYSTTTTSYAGGGPNFVWDGQWTIQVP